MLNKCINASDYQVSSPVQEPIQLYDVLWIPNTQKGVGSGLGEGGRGLRYRCLPGTVTLLILLACYASGGSWKWIDKENHKGSSWYLDLTRWPAARADIRLSSPARTVPQTILSRFHLRSIKFGCHMGALGNYLASWLAFSPGKEG